MFSIFESLYPSENDIYRCKYDENSNELTFPMIGERDTMTLDEIQKKISNECRIVGYSDGCNCAMTFLEDIQNNDELKKKISFVQMNVPYDKMNTKTALGFVGRNFPLAVKTLWNTLKREDEIEVQCNLTREQINNNINDIAVEREKRNPVVNALWNYIARPVITGLCAIVLAPLVIVSLPFIGIGMLGKSIHNRVRGVDNSKYTQDRHIADRFSEYLESNKNIKGEIKYAINDTQVGDLGLTEINAQGNHGLKKEFKNIPQNLEINVYDSKDHSCCGNNIFTTTKNLEIQFTESMVNLIKASNPKYSDMYRNVQHNKQDRGCHRVKGKHAYL